MQRHKVVRERFRSRRRVPPIAGYTAVVSDKMLFFILGLWIAVAGAELLILAVGRELQYRRQGRCPKCWYDMTGAPTPTCPECGHKTTRKKQIHQIRWRQGRVLTGIGLLVLGITVMQWPTLRYHNWPRYVPTWLLIEMWDSFDWQWATSELGDRFDVRLYNRPAWYQESWQRPAIGADADDFADTAIKVLHDPETLDGLRVNLLQWLRLNRRLPSSIGPNLTQWAGSANVNLRLSEEAIACLGMPPFNSIISEDDTAEVLIDAHKRGATLYSPQLSLQALAKSSSTRAQEYFEELFTSKDAEVRAHALRFAPMNSEFMPWFISALEDSEQSCRIAAGARLSAAMVNPDVVVSIIAGWLDTSDVVHGLRLLGRYPEDAGTYADKIISLLRSDDTAVRRHAATTISKCVHIPAFHAALPELIHLMRVGYEPAERWEAAMAILAFPDDELMKYRVELQAAIIDCETKVGLVNPAIVAQIAAKVKGVASDG